MSVDTKTPPEELATYLDIEYPAFCIGQEVGLLRRFARRRWLGGYTLSEGTLDDCLAEIEKQVAWLRRVAAERFAAASQVRG